jgi:hypothetical protein
VHLRDLAISLGGAGVVNAPRDGPFQREHGWAVLKSYERDHARNGRSCVDLTPRPLLSPLADLARLPTAQLVPEVHVFRTGSAGPIFLLTAKLRSFAGPCLWSGVPVVIDCL